MPLALMERRALRTRVSVRVSRISVRTYVCVCVYFERCVSVHL